MELKGRVARLLQVTSGTSQQGNAWVKQEFIFGYYEHESDIYERTIVCTVMNDNIDKLKLKENDKISVRVSLGCREYNGRYFNDIRTGDITVLERHNGGNAPAESNPAQEQKAPEQTEVDWDNMGNS